MPNKRNPSDFLNFGDDTLRKEEAELQKLIEELSKRLKAGNSSKALRSSLISNVDLLNYLRVINFNFAMLNRLIQTIFIRQGIVEESVLRMTTTHAEIMEKFSSFLDLQELLEEADESVQAKNES